ncbi:MAG: hypothetical protein ACREPU_03575 [Rhodanobacteraceae bacterium]
MTEGQPGGMCESLEFTIDPSVTPMFDLAPRSWVPEKSEVESHKNQDDAEVDDQPFPKSMSEKHKIHADYNGCHRHHVNHHSYLSAHLGILQRHFRNMGTSFLRLIVGLRLDV